MRSCNYELAYCEQDIRYASTAMYDGMMYEDKLCSHYRKMYFACLITLVLNFVSGTLAQFVRVNPAIAKLGEYIVMTFTFTPAPGEELSFVSWYKSDAGGVVQGDAIITNIFGNTQPNGKYSLNGYLIISDVLKEDTGYYMCSVITSTGRNADGFSTLTVHYLETPTLGPKYIYVNETENAIFTCPLPDGVPIPITTTWIKDGGVLDVSDTEKYPQSDTTLEINRVNEMDEGDYQCRAENAAYSGDGGKLSNNGTLLVVTRLISTATSTSAAATDLAFIQPISTLAATETEATQDSPKCEPYPGSDTGLVVGMTFLGIVIGIVLSSSVYVFLWRKTRTSSSKSSEETQTGKQVATYMTYTSEQKTESQTYQDLRTDEDNPVVYVNVKTKR